MWYDSIFSKKNSAFSSIKFKKSRLNVINYLIPNNYQLLVVYNSYLKSIKLIIYSKVYYFVIPLLTKQNTIKFDNNSNQVLIYTNYQTNYSQIYLKIFHMFFKTFIRPDFIKIKFKGKGYYIYKNYRNTITPQFGYSHRLYLYSFKLNVLFLSKSSLIIFGLNPLDVSLVSRKIRDWRKINIFTGRGVRFSKQIVYKKSGKVSTYR